MVQKKDVLIGVDAGTSVIKAVAFTLEGNQIGCASVQNQYEAGRHGAATQSMSKTWSNCVEALRELNGEVPDLGKRVAGVAVTGQGDGTWLVGKEGKPVDDAWIWLDARAAPTVDRLFNSPGEPSRFARTGTGLNTCQQSAQLAHMKTHYPDLLNAAETALHCKDWLYLCLTGVRATDPSEASFTFGDFRTRRYDDEVLAALELDDCKHLLPDIVEGSETTHPLSREAARMTGLPAGTPVSLGYVDMVLTGLGAGVYTGDTESACSIIGSTGVHMRPARADQITLNEMGTGYIMVLPLPGLVTQMQSNMAATLNVDWLLGLVSQVASEEGQNISPQSLLRRLDTWLANAQPAQVVYHPYISEAGERGPFINAHASASFIGLASHHNFTDLVRAIVDGLAMATRECYSTMGRMPREIRMSGGAARSGEFRSIIAAAIGCPVRVSIREESGAAGAAMMSAVAIGAYSTMEDCIAEWVTPLLGENCCPQPDLQTAYSGLYERYIQSRDALAPTWSKLPQAGR